MRIEVTDELVRKVANLSRLALTPELARELKSHFEKILAFIEDFQALDTEGVDPTHFSNSSFNVYREDVHDRESLANSAALQNAPSSKPPYFVVPRILGDVSEDDMGGG